MKVICAEAKNRNLDNIAGTLNDQLTKLEDAGTVVNVSAPGVANVGTVPNNSGSGLTGTNAFACITVVYNSTPAAAGADKVSWSIACAKSQNFDVLTVADQLNDVLDPGSSGMEILQITSPSLASSGMMPAGAGQAGWPAFGCIAFKYRFKK